MDVAHLDSMALLEHASVPAGTTAHATSDAAARRGIARTTMAGALVAGVLGDLLLRHGPGGVGLVLYLEALVAGTVVLVRRRAGYVPFAAREPLRAAALFALLPVVRDSEFLAFWAAIACVTALALAAAAAAPDADTGLARLRVGAAARHLARLGSDAVFGTAIFAVREHASLITPASVRRLRAARGVVRALAITAVVVTPFALLLAAGDPIFARSLGWFGNWDVKAVVSHVALTVFFGWPAIGWLHHWSRTSMDPWEERDAKRRFLSSADVVLMLTGLNVLFTAYVLVQLRVLFGGQAYVRQVTGLTIAEYARGGFFVLVAVTALVVVTLLACDGLLRDATLGAHRAARRLAPSLLGLVAVVMISALVRMGLYVQSFGLSSERLYATAAMGWIAALLVVLRLTVLRDRANAFSLAALRTGWVTLFALAAMNPDAVVVRVNAAYATRAPFDYAYVNGILSDDAVPSLVDVLTQTHARDLSAPAVPSCRVLDDLVRTHTADAPPVATWNLGRLLARRAVSANVTALRSLPCDTTVAGST